jgi:PKD repeat protein
MLRFFGKIFSKKICNIPDTTKPIRLFSIFTALLFIKPFPHRMLRHITFFALTCAFPAFLAAQAPSLGGVVNRYAAVSAIDTCSGRLAVSDTAGFAKGDAILLVQMQGADIFSGNNLLYGILQATNFVGRHERATVDSVAAGAIFVQKRLVYAYNIGGRLQVVRIARFADATVADTLRAKPWDGSSGGVIALELSGNLALNAPIVASGAGFRGAAGYVGPGNDCNFLFPELGFVYGLGNWRGARKGEGIAAEQAGNELGRGPQANGGGGGNDHNAGGGGGGHLQQGGDGGNNDEPSLFGCDGYYPGIGGYGIALSNNRLFLGGGGGAGHANNSTATRGGNGGGIVYLQANSITGTQPTIYSRGGNAPASQGDGAGGGGAGGSVWLQCANPSPALLVDVRGGNGGSAGNNGANRCFGPGGGGSGGRVLSNIPTLATQLNGGLNGLTLNSSNACNNQPNGAEPGEAGSSEGLAPIPQGTQDYLIPKILQAPLPDTLCPGQDAAFGVTASDGNWQYQWQRDDGSGWADLPNTAPFVGTNADSLRISPVQSAQAGWRFRCRVIRPGCYETISAPAGIVLLDSPAASFIWTAQSIDNVAFTGSIANADGLFWDFGDGSPTLPGQPAPTHQFPGEGSYPVTLTVWNGCDTVSSTQTINLFFPPQAAFTVDAATLLGCGQATVQFSNNSSANSSGFLWLFPGGSPSSSNAASPSVTYSFSGNYTATLIAQNAAGNDTIGQQIVVQVIPLPVAAFGFSTLSNDGSVAFSYLGSAGDSFRWDFGDGSPTLPGQPAPTHQFPGEGSYPVTLTVWNGCDTVSVTQTVNLFFLPQAAFTVDAATLLGCEQATVQFSNSSSANSSGFLWLFPGGSPSSSNAAAPSVTYSNSGNYTATLIAQNAAGNDTIGQQIAVQVFDFPTADFNFATFAGGVVQFSDASLNGSNLTWDFGDGSPQVSAQANVSHQFAESGTYTITLIASNACGASIYQQNISVVVQGLGSTNPAEPNGILLYPNPVRDRLTVKTQSPGAQIREAVLFPNDGKTLLGSASVPASETTLDLSQLPAGSYLLQVRWDGGFAARWIIKAP